MINKKRRLGFTIVELVIVIAVIAILAAILIPTFVNITKKANLSADMVAVKEMNTILAAEEITDGKPATVVDAQEVLKSNGINDFTPMSSNNVFYWVASDNRVLLWDNETSKVTYPEELVKKYKDATSILKDWSRLDEYGFIEVTPTEGQTIGEALNVAVKNAKDGAYIKLPENSEMNIGMYAYYWGASYLKKQGGTGKTLTIDLNGGKLVSNEELVLNGTNYGYYEIQVPSGGTLTLTNGSVDITTEGSTYAAFSPTTGSTLVLKNINMKTNGAAVFPEGTASEIVIEDSVIEGGAYGVGTNRAESHNISINIKNSSISASSAVFINTASDTHISNSTITGVVHGIALRAGVISVENSTIITTDTEPGNFLYNNFAYELNFNGYWQVGNKIPAGTIVLGDYHNGNTYSGDAICTLNNTKLQTSNTNILPEVLLAAYDSSKVVSLNYDETSSVPNIKVYGDDWNPTGNNVNVVISNKGTMKVNGVGQLRYVISNLFGTFAAESELNSSDLNVINTDEGYDYTDNVKNVLLKERNISLSDTEWETARLEFSSATERQLKKIHYTKDDGTKYTETLSSRYTFTEEDIPTDFPKTLLNTVEFASFKKATTQRNCLNEVKLYCEKIGFILTEDQWSNVKFIIGENNTIVNIVVE